ncbi:MAG: GAF domain-containing protein [Salinibacterium sp.]|nr:GAF domain-containing protein [Salinibacterium sp.]
MLDHIRNSMISPRLDPWFANSAGSWRSLPRPEDRAVVQIDGPIPDRVLVIGAGVAAGYGVTTHDRSLAGNLATALPVLTGRGVDVHVDVHPNMSVADCREVFVASNAGKFDAVLAVVGGIEAIALLSDRAWAQQIKSLMDVMAESAPNARLFFLGIPALPASTPLTLVRRQMSPRRVISLNEITKSLCELSNRATFIEFGDEIEDLASMIGRNAYRTWGEMCAGPIAEDLNRASAARLERDAGESATAAWDEALRAELAAALGASESPISDKVDKIVAKARALFGVNGAAVNLIEANVQRVKSASGVAREETPRSESISDVTIRSAKTHVIENLEADERFKRMSWMRKADHIRFYAGHAIEAPDGSRIGALCVVDSAPRGFDAADQALLQELTREIERALWQRMPLAG